MRRFVFKTAALLLAVLLLFTGIPSVRAEEGGEDPAPAEETAAPEDPAEEGQDPEAPAGEDPAAPEESTPEEDPAEEETIPEQRWSEDLELSNPLELPKEPEALNIVPDTIASNVYFKGESLSGMKLEEALKKVTAVSDAIMDSHFIVQSKRDDTHNFGADAETLGISTNSDLAEELLASSVIKGTLLERYKMAKDIQLEPRVVDLGLSYDKDAILEYYNTELESWNSEPANADVSVSFGEIKVTEGHIGYKVDFTEGVDHLAEELDAYHFDEPVHYYIDMEETTLEPEFTTEHAKEFTIIGSCTTHYVAPTTEYLHNRENNLIVSTSNMNGKRFAPGERVSALHNLYGEVSLAGGYLPAGTINGAGHTMEVGGGICQTTTTLYDAILQAELQVNYRNHHSKLVLYVQPSFDAMVYAQGDSDFIFTNNTPDFIILNSYVDTSTLSVTVNIIGIEEHSPSHRVEYVSVVDAVQAPEITIQPNTTTRIGYKDVSKKIQLVGIDGPQCGITSRLIKRVWEGDTVVEEKQVSRDIYKPDSATYLVAPDAYLAVGTSGDYTSAFVSLGQYFADQITPLSADPARMTPEERIAFNKRMKAATKGAWPYSNDGYTDDEPNGTTEKEEETTKKGDKKDDKKETKKEEEKPAPKTDPEPAPEDPAPSPED